jgi:tetratricopeptide (TPR) repeat protein
MKMKIGNIILGASMLLASVSFAQEDADRECKRMRFIANEAMRAENYKEAVEYFLKGETICGDFDDANYSRLTGSLINMINSEKDDATKKSYADTLIQVWERMDEKGLYKNDNDLMRGYYNLQTTKPDSHKADAFFKRGVETGGPALQEMYVTYYYYNTYPMFYAEKDAEKKGALKKRMIGDYFYLSKLITDAKFSLTTQESITKYFNSVVQSCEDLTPEIPGFIENLPEEPEAAKKALMSLITLMEEKKCEDTPEYLDLINKYLDVDPKSAQALTMKAKILEKQKKYTDANAIYKKLINLEEIQGDEKGELEYKIAYNLYRMGSYKAAYSAGKAVTGSSRGKGIEIAGKAVGATAMTCGASTFDRKCNYIYAIQLLQQSGVSNDGTIAKYEKLKPNSDDCFRNNSPASVTLECWGVTVNPCN